MSLKQKIYDNKANILLLVLWSVFQLLMYYNSKIVTISEAEKYINAAYEMNNYGRFPVHYISYSSYVVFLAILFKLGLNYFGVYLVQLGLNLLATIAFFKIVKTITNHQLTAYIAVTMYILFYQLQHWNTHLFTESFMVSILMIFWYYILHINLKKAAGKISLTILVIVFLFSRPTAILFLPGILIYWILRNKTLLKEAIQLKWIILSAFVLLILFICFIHFEKRVLFSDLFISLQEGQTICGTNYFQEHFVSMEQNNAFLQNLIVFCKVSCKKLLLFYGFIRPFYSMSHNLMLMAYYPVYPLAIIGIVKSKINKEHQYMMLTFILLINLLLIITCDSWEGRFIVPILPFIIVFAAIGLNKIITLFINSYHKQY